LWLKINHKEYNKKTQGAQSQKKDPTLLAPDLFFDNPSITSKSAT